MVVFRYTQISTKVKLKRGKMDIAKIDRKELERLKMA